MGRVFWIFMILILTGCASKNTDQQVAVKDIEGSEYSYIGSKKIDKFLVNKPDAFKQFNKVILFATQFDQLKIALETDKKLAADWNDSTWTEMDQICQQLDDFAHKTFKERGEFVPVTRGGNDVLAIQFSLISFMPYSNRYKNSGTGTVGAQSNQAGIGQITVRGVLANAKTGELVAVVEDTLEVNARLATRGNLANVQDSNNKMAQNMAWRSTFRRFLDNLHFELDKLKHATVAIHP